MKIGVFDSGVGGKSVAEAIKATIPNAEVELVEDRENLPYGTKTKQQLLELVTPIFLKMQESGCEVIVVACNSVTTNIITELRQAIKVPLVGIEPMVKPAAKLTKTRKITVCATPATLNSVRYEWLKSEYANDIQILEPDCSLWASMIEDNSVDEQQIRNIIKESDEFGSDVIVLGCTHYHWIYDFIEENSGKNIKILQPTDAVIGQLKRVVQLLG